MKKKENKIKDVFLKICAIIVISEFIIIVLLILLSFLSSLKKDDNNYQDSIISNDNDKYDKVTGKINETINTSNLSITLDKVETTDIIESNYDTLTAKEGNEFIILTLTIKNNATQSIYIFDDDFDFILDNKNYDNTYFYDGISGIDRLSGEIEAKSNLTGYIIYEVNKNWEMFDIHYKDKTNSHHYYDVSINYINNN